ncbi:MAG: VOC family protein [Defluviitaleaceae bacterium]|nr:VOC family protein [Defluviitaleaceae bacterium]
MKAQIMLTVNGSSRKAMEFYAEIFQLKFSMTTYGEIPTDPNNPLCESGKDKIAWGNMTIGDLKINFGDKLSDSSFVHSDNVVLHLAIKGAEEATRIFNKLKVEGEILEDLHEEFFADIYGRVIDKFGVTWNILGLGSIAYKNAIS